MAVPHRLRKSKERLRRYLAKGWQRAVFATPQRDDLVMQEETVSCDAQAPISFEDLFASAMDAAGRGLVKQVFVVDPQRKIVVDARNGVLSERRLDEERAKKIMGGKERSLRPDSSEGLLRAIGIMNADGSISAKHAKKYKQISHLAQLVAPICQQIARQQACSESRPLGVVDLACGNSYLTFIVAESLRLSQTPAQILGVDVREDVIARSTQRASTMEFANIHFRQATIVEAEREITSTLRRAPDIVVALHACDTATDEALAFAISVDTPAILCVPCCHAQVAAQLQKSKSCELAALWQQGLLRRAYGETLTDGFRVEILQAYGYEVKTLEFVGSEHTPKNLLICATRSKSAPSEDFTGERLASLAQQARKLGIWPELLARLVPPAPAAP